MTLLDLPRVFIKPSALFADIAAARPSVFRVIFGYALWLGLVPVVCAYLGVTRFGLRLGVGEAVFFSAVDIALFAVGYYVVLLVGYAAAVWFSRWMAPTYGADGALELHVAFVAVVATPLAVGGVVHLYSHLPLNLLCFVPALLWSAYLLYTGIAVVFQIDVARGMLMASSLLGVVFVAALAGLILMMVLWTHGVGPNIGFDWRSAVGS